MGYFEEFKERYNVKSDVIALACWYEDNVFEPAKPGEDYIELYDSKTRESVRIACHCVFNCMVLAMKQLKHIGCVSIVYDRKTTQSGNELVKRNIYEYDADTDTVVCVGDCGCYSVPGEREFA